MVLHLLLSNPQYLFCCGNSEIIAHRCPGIPCDCSLWMRPLWQPIKSLGDVKGYKSGLTALVQVWPHRTSVQLWGKEHHQSIGNNGIHPEHQFRDCGLPRKWQPARRWGIQNTVLLRGRKLIGWHLDGSDFSPEPLKAGTTEANFQKDKKTNFDKQRLYRFDRTGDNSGKHIFRTIAGIQSGLVAFEMSSPWMIFPNFLRSDNNSGYNIVINNNNNVNVHTGGTSR